MPFVAELKTFLVFYDNWISCKNAYDRCDSAQYKGNTNAAENNFFTVSIICDSKSTQSFWQNFSILVWCWRVGLAGYVEGCDVVLCHHFQ